MSEPKDNVPEFSFPEQDTQNRQNHQRTPLDTDLRVDPRDHIDAQGGDDYEEDESVLYGVNRLWVAGGAMFAMGVFAAIVWFAYSWGVGDVAEDQLPVITAQSGNIKVKPENPGGMDIAHTDTMVLNKEEDGNKVIERLLPPPDMPSAPDPQSATAAGVSTPEIPAKREDAAPTSQPSTNQPVEQNGSSQTSKPVETAALSDASAVKPSANAPSSGFVVQLFAVKTEEAAKGAWKTVFDKHQALFEGKELRAEKVDLGEGKGIVFRVQAGYFKNRSDADVFCKALKTQKQDCFVKQF